jgi:hypothetical protein
MTASTIVVDAGIDPDKMLLADIDTTKGPIFTVSEMAKFFFARSNHWIRWLEGCEFEYPPASGTGKGVKCSIQPKDHDPELRDAHCHTWKLMLDGRLVGTRRNEKSARIYTLSDVEEIAHALAQSGSITGTQLRNTITVIKTQAEMFEYLP